MRVVRTILGILLLTIGLPVMLAGGGLWTAMQHRDAGGAFTGALQETSTTGYALLVPDIDGLLRRDASFVRGGNTRLRITAETVAAAAGRPAGAAAPGPAFVGLAPAADVARYLAGVSYLQVDEVNLATGALPLRGTPVTGDAEPPGPPTRQTFWLRSGAGAVDWTPAELRDEQLALVIMSPTARPELTVRATAEVRPGWIDATAWGLATLGAVLLIAGVITLAWPGRRRDFVYVVEPDRVAELARRIGAPLPIEAGPAPAAPPAVSGPPSIGRPASLGDTGDPTRDRNWPASAPPPAMPVLAWPPMAQSRPPHALSSGPSDTLSSGPSAAPVGSASADQALPLLAGDRADANSTAPTGQSGTGRTAAPGSTGSQSRAATAAAAEPAVVGTGPGAAGAAPPMSPSEDDVAAEGEWAAQHAATGARAAEERVAADTGPVGRPAESTGKPVASGMPARTDATPAVAAPAGAAARSGAEAVPATAGIPAQGGPEPSAEAEPTELVGPTGSAGVAGVVGSRAGRDSGGVPDEGVVPASTQRSSAVDNAATQPIAAMPGIPAARPRRRKTAGGLPAGDAVPVEQMLKTTRPARHRPPRRAAAAKLADDAGTSEN